MSFNSPTNLDELTFSISASFNFTSSRFKLTANSVQVLSHDPDLKGLFADTVERSMAAYRHRYLEHGDRTRYGDEVSYYLKRGQYVVAWQKSNGEYLVSKVLTRQQQTAIEQGFIERQKRIQRLWDGAPYGDPYREVEE